MQKQVMYMALLGVFTLVSELAISSVIALDVPNYSFETPVTSTFNMEIGSWEDPGSTGVFRNSGQFGNVISNAVGNQMAFMNCNSTGLGADKNNIYIDIAHPLTKGTYTLTVGIAARRDSVPSNPANTKMQLKLFARVPTLTTLASQEVVYSSLSNTALTYYSAVLNADAIPASALGSDLGIWLDSTLGTGGDWTLDNVTLTMIPMSASNPIPSSGLVDAGVATGNGNEVTVELSWETGRNSTDQVHPDITTHYLYLSTGEPNFVDVDPIAIPAGTPPSAVASYVMAATMDTTYYWRVNEGINGSSASDPNTIIGPVWSFETLKSIPVIVSNPQDQHAAAGQTVEFTVAATSISPMTYRWYQSSDNATNTIDDDVTIGTNSPTLTVVNVSLADEKYYYCVIGNESGTLVTSTPAFLEFERLTAWYAFENDLTDSAGDYDGIAIKLDPNLPFAYNDGAVGTSIVLNGVDEAVQIGRSIRDSFTIAFWVKTSAVGGTGGWWSGIGLVDGDMPGAVNDFGTSVSGDKLAFGVGPDTTITSASSINDNHWRYCVATRDHISGQMKLYVNGTLETTAAGPVGRLDAPDSLRIGKIRSGLNYLSGQIDEVKLYNYVLTEIEIAQSYNDVTGESVCLTSAKPLLDLNNDCKVDLTDFAMLAPQWLQCSVFPDCVQ